MKKYPGNPKQEQTKGRMFVSTGIQSHPVVGEYYKEWMGDRVCICEDEDFPKKSLPHLICKPYIPWWQRWFK